MEKWKEVAPSASDLKQFVRCNRCKHVHLFGDRLCKKDPKRIGRDIVCPKCECKVHIAFTIEDYKKAVAKESKHYQFLKACNGQFDEETIRLFYVNGTSPTEACNAMLDAV